MLNPPNFSQSSSSYMGLLKRMTENVQQAKVDDRILQIVRQVYETELVKQKIVLSRPEIERLFRQVMKAVLTDMLAKIDDAK